MIAKKKSNISIIELPKSDKEKLKKFPVIDGMVDAELKQKFSFFEHQEIHIENFFKEFMSSFMGEQTKRAYLLDLAMFVQFLSKGGLILNHPKDIKHHHFALYRDHLMQLDYAPATINRRLVVIRSFLKWSMAMKLIDYNPLDAIKLPKVQTLAPTIALDDQEAKQLMDSPNTQTFSGNTHRLVLVLLFQLGLRRSEIGKIKVKDIFNDRGHTVLKIFGKGDKHRFLPLNATTLEEIQNYLTRFENFKNIKLLPDDFLIQTLKKRVNHKACDGSTIFRIVRRYAQRLGIKKDIGAHSCRATVISHLLDTQKISIRDVALFAGHSNISTTEKYDKKRKGLDDSAAYAVDFNKKNII